MSTRHTATAYLDWCYSVFYQHRCWIRTQWMKPFKLSFVNCLPSIYWQGSDLFSSTLYYLIWNSRILYSGLNLTLEHDKISPTKQFYVLGQFHQSCPRWTYLIIWFIDIDISILRVFFSVFYCSRMLIVYLDYIQSDMYCQVLFNPMFDKKYFATFPIIKKS